MIKEIQPIEADKLLNEDPKSVLIDVRSTMEFEYVGHPLKAIHVAIKEPPEWETEATFVVQVRQILDDIRSDIKPSEDIPLLLLCRSGKRSELAAQLLEQDGFNNLYNVIEGFEGDKDENGHRNTINGWRFHNLPWKQS